MVFNQAKRIYFGSMPQDASIQGSELVWERSYGTLTGLAQFLSDSGDTLRLPAGTQTIGYQSFRGCTIGTIVVPASVTSVHWSAFRDFEGHTIILNMPSSQLPQGIRCPDTVTVIWKGSNPAGHEPEGAADAVFSAVLDRSVTQLTVPRGTTKLREYALTHCQSLTTLHIPRSVRTLELSALWNSRALTGVTLEAGLKTIGAAFVACIALRSMTIPSTVRTISTSAFYDSVAIPVNLTIHRPVNSITGAPWSSSGSVVWTASAQ